MVAQAHVAENESFSTICKIIFHVMSASYVLLIDLLIEAVKMHGMSRMLFKSLLICPLLACSTQVSFAADEAPNAKAENKVPAFKFNKDNVIAVVGNGLADRMQHSPWLESLLHASNKDSNLTFRNMSMSGDRVNKTPRSKGFTSQHDYLKHVKANTVFSFFGYNESYDTSPADYQAQLEQMVKGLQGVKHGEPAVGISQIVLFSPTAFEQLDNPNFPAADAVNKKLEALTEATKKAAQKSGAHFVDIFHPTLELYKTSKKNLTINGLHLNDDGYKAMAEVIASKLLAKEVKVDGSIAKLHKIVTEKNHYWHQRYRATDGNDIWGGRSTLSFVDGQTNKAVLAHELSMLDVLTQNRDKAVWATAQGKNYKIDDSNVPKPVKVVSNVGGGSKSSSKAKEGSLTYLNGEEGLTKMHHPKDFKVNLFASEKEFPQLVNPVQMQVDAKGRVWAAVWPTYPKWKPQEKTGDALLIFADTDNDGKADKVTKFATVHNPLGFEFWNGGVLVATQPDLIFLKDTDGDDIADVREIVLQGFGTSDTHHAANNLVYGPDGGIYWQSGVFLVNNFEHPWGKSLNTGASAMFRFDPRRHTVAYHAANSPNPHGTSFDYWGYHFANDGTGGRSYQVRPEGKGFKMHALVKKEVRPVAADQIISSTNFPDDMQQDFLVCNTIGYLGLKRYKLHRDGYEKHKVGEVWGTPTDDFLRSDDKNFRPTDAVFGADGALYIADWHNVIIGHMQHNVRDPNRDAKHGRIYRMVYTKKPLQKQVKIDGASIEELLENLKHPTNSVRHSSRVELTKHDSTKVIAAVNKWVKSFDPKKKEDAHHLLEALWLHQQHNVRDMDLLEAVLNSPEEHARIAANTVKHHWTVADPAKGAQKIEKEKRFKTNKGGITRDAKNRTDIRINTVIEKLKFDVESVTVKAGKRIRLTFVNPDALPHNFVLVKPGTADKVAAAAIALGADGFKKEFIPESDDIIIHSKMLERRQTEVLNFKAPKKPGVYQFICTFPGHDKIMRGTLIVEK